jgi:hypothetical protein
MRALTSYGEPSPALCWIWMTGHPHPESLKQRLAFDKRGLASSCITPSR